MNHVLPLLTALLLALYISVPGTLDAHADPSVASVTELQDDFVSANPRHDDPVVVPAEVDFQLPPVAGFALTELALAQPDFHPTVPNIRDPPRTLAV